MEEPLSSLVSTQTGATRTILAFNLYSWVRIQLGITFALGERVWTACDMLLSVFETFNWQQGVHAGRNGVWICYEKQGPEAG